MERVDSLSEQAKVLIKICACFGFEFRQESLENVAPQFLSSQDSLHLEDTLAQLAVRSLVVPLAPDLVEGKAKFMILPFNTHMNMFIAMSVHPLVSLYDHKVKQGVDATKYINALKEMRESIETFAKGIPGNMRCSGTYYIAQITLALRDRPFGEMFKKMEKALEYAIELECLPVEIVVLEAGVARWKGDKGKLQEIYDKCESKNFKYISVIVKQMIDGLDSGDLNHVDLEFAPEVIEIVLSDEEKLEKLQKDLKIAKQDMKDAEIQEVMQAARARAKVIKTEIKNLKKMIADKSKPTVDQAMIDDLNAKILNAQTRQEEAFDNDDDDAEEAASAEIIELKKQLEELMTSASIPKQKLEDAKKIDAEINK